MFIVDLFQISFVNKIFKLYLCTPNLGEIVLFN